MCNVRWGGYDTSWLIAHNMLNLNSSLNTILSMINAYYRVKCSIVLYRLEEGLQWAV